MRGHERPAPTCNPSSTPILTLAIALFRCDAQRGARRKGMLSDERVDYLTAIGFEWEGPGSK